MSKRLDQHKNTDTINIAAIRARGFATAQAIISGLGRLDEAIRMATDGTIDEQQALIAAARRLATLLDGSAVSR